MTRIEAEKLLGGYATGTLTEAERRAEESERRAFFAEATLAFQKGLAHA